MCQTHTFIYPISQTRKTDAARLSNLLPVTKLAESEAEPGSAGRRSKPHRFSWGKQAPRRSQQSRIPFGEHHLPALRWSPVNCPMVATMITLTGLPATPSCPWPQGDGHGEGASLGGSERMPGSLPTHGFHNTLQLDYRFKCKK